MREFQKILIANRGEIAVRIIRACREMNIKTVAVYASVDKDSLHVILADEAVCIGNHEIQNSYLNANAILQAAINTGAQAIHPGYGFLSENAQFVRMCEAIGIVFIGPKAFHIEQMGDKQTARESMIKAGVPIVPGSKGIVDTVEEAFKVSQEIGYPVLIKATAGGGGKGMRICYEETSLKALFLQAKQEAALSFGNDDVYIERFVESPRHVEMQVIADKHGNGAHLFERECSVQRKNQKLIEEAPIQNLSPSTRKRLYKMALNAMSKIKYESLGTLEFIMDKDENIYFIEMNTRLQVEHTVTEMITGIDLVKEQIRIAEGKPLSFKQRDLKIHGHAIEMRINAEKPYHGFMPSTGIIKSVHFPGGNGIRLDSFVYQGYKVLPFYDSMIGKIIVHAPIREEAIERALSALEELDIDGIETNAEFLLDILHSKDFSNNTYTTGLVPKLLEEGDR